jgi:hypothetical protein
MKPLPKVIERGLARYERELSAGLKIPDSARRAIQEVLHALGNPKVRFVWASCNMCSFSFTFAGRKCRLDLYDRARQLTANPELPMSGSDALICPIWVKLGPKRCFRKRWDVIGMSLDCVRRGHERA